MFPSVRKVLLVGAVAAAALSFSSADADAYWGYYSPVGWGYSAYASPWSSCAIDCDPCGGYWYLGWRPGPVRRLLLGRYRWYYYPGYGCWNYCYGWTSCCEPCCYVTGYGEMPTEAEGGTPTPAKKPETTTPGPTPAMPQPEQPSPTETPSPYGPLTPPPVPPVPGEAPALPGETTPGLPEAPTTPGTPSAPSTTPPATLPGPAGGTMPGLDTGLGPLPGTTVVPTAENSALLTVWVPYDAKVTINGLPTRSAGSKRQYVSYDLKPGYSYAYKVRAEVIRDGRPVVETRTAVLTAGSRDSVVFEFNPSYTEGLAATP
jgi:uncharacterized protein (TIGR03000 family)